MAPKDYSTWCEHALSGAYDWIDHDRLASAPSSSPTPSSGRATQTQASRNAAPASTQQASGSAVPDWLTRNNATRNAAPAATPTAASRDVPTVPVPAAPRASDGAQPASYAPGQSAGEDDDDSSRRNIFRIFTN
jgi:hypothetical protein